jgi:nucleotide-binding universal stress UspA family protein
MTLTSLSVVVSSEATDGPALEAASAIALREDAHLEVICLGVEPMAMTAMALEGGAAIFRDSDFAAAQERANVLGQWAQRLLPSSLRARVQRLTVPSSGLAGEVARAARCSDLAVAVRPYGPGHVDLAPVIGEALLFGTAGPVLVVPDQEKTDWRRPFRRLCLAWNGSDEVLRATRLALPFLRQADQVDIAIIDPPVHGRDQPDPGEAPARWLSRHGVRVEVAVLARTERRKADVLAHFAAERGCEGLVLGAYGHSRLREMLLGGTTRDLLAEVPLPLLMAH